MRVGFENVQDDRCDVTAHRSAYKKIGITYPLIFTFSVVYIFRTFFSLFFPAKFSTDANSSNFAPSKEKKRFFVVGKIVLFFNLKTCGSGARKKAAKNMTKANVKNNESKSAQAQVNNASAQAREESLFLKEWRKLKEEIGSPNNAYRNMYTCASEELRAALIVPKVLFDAHKNGDEITHAKYNAYVAYANEHKGAKGVSAWFAYLWAQKEMREYMTTAKADDKRAKAIAKVQRAQRNERQQKAVAKK